MLRHWNLEKQLHQKLNKLENKTALLLYLVCYHYRYNFINFPDFCCMDVMQNIFNGFMNGHRNVKHLIILYQTSPTFIATFRSDNVKCKTQIDQRSNQIDHVCKNRCALTSENNARSKKSIQDVLTSTYAHSLWDSISNKPKSSKG